MYRVANRSFDSTFPRNDTPFHDVPYTSCTLDWRLPFEFELWRGQFLLPGTLYKFAPMHLGGGEKSSAHSVLEYYAIWTKCANRALFLGTRG